MVLELTWEVYGELRRVGRDAAPVEACGLLAGVENRATRFYPLSNADASAGHFSMIPEEQFAAVKDMRRSGLKMLAIWHSHPASPARMSAEDLRLALTPDAVYMILSLATEPPSLAAYSVRDGVAEQVAVNLVGGRE